MRNRFLQALLITLGLQLLVALAFARPAPWGQRYIEVKVTTPELTADFI